MQEIARGRLPLMDGVRGLAAIFVMLYHVGEVFDFVGPFRRSYLFVDFFFLLSGFVLALSAEPKMRSGLSTAGFMRARLLRLWPVIAVGVIFGAFQAVIADGRADPLLILAAFLIIPAFWQNGLIFPFNGPQWSLMLELAANLMHGLLLRRLGDRTLLLLAILSGLLLALTIFHFGSNTLGPFSFNWWFALPRIAFSYTMGVWIGRKWQDRKAGAPFPWKLALLLPAIALLILPGLPMAVALGDAAMVLLIFPPLLWLLATSEPPENARRWLDALGKLSFPLYAVHLPLLCLVALLGKGWVAAMLGAICAIGVAHLTARLLETKTRVQSSRRQTGMAFAE